MMYVKTVFTVIILTEMSVLLHWEKWYRKCVTMSTHGDSPREEEGSGEKDSKE